MRSWLHSFLVNHDILISVQRALERNAKLLVIYFPHILHNFIGWLANLGNFHCHLEAVFRNETQYMRGKGWARLVRLAVRC